METLQNGISCGKSVCRSLHPFPIKMWTTIFNSLSENNMWLLLVLSSYLCMKVNAVMRCPNVVKPCWPNKHLINNFRGGRVLRSGGWVLRGSGGQVLHGAEFSTGPSFGLGLVLRRAEFSGIHVACCTSVNAASYVSFRLMYRPSTPLKNKEMMTKWQLPQILQYLTPPKTRRMASGRSVSPVTLIDSQQIWQHVNKGWLSL